VEFTDPCQDDKIVVPSHPFHDAETGDESKDDKGGRCTHNGYGHGEHDGSSVFEMAGGVGHDRRLRSRSVAFLLRVISRCSPSSRPREPLPATMSVTERWRSRSAWKVKRGDWDGLLYDTESSSSHWMPHWAWREAEKRVHVLSSHLGARPMICRGRRLGPWGGGPGVGLEDVLPGYIGTICERPQRLLFSRSRLSSHSSRFTRISPAVMPRLLTVLLLSGDSRAAR